MDNRKILLTGAMGYLGKAYCCLLENVLTLGRGKENLIVCDLAEEIPKIEYDIDLVIHCAGKAHIVPKTQKDKDEFYSVNVLGTQNLLKGIEVFGKIPGYFIFISSVAVYGRKSGVDIKEDAELLAGDPYGSSKIEAEMVLTDWCKKNNVTLTIIRVPLIIGPNPKGNLRQMTNAIKKGYYFRIGNGNAQKSVVFIKDIVTFSLMNYKTGGIYNLTDGYNPTILELEKFYFRILNKKYKPLVISSSLLRIFSYFFDLLEKLLGKTLIFNTDKLEKLTSDLTFSNEKVKQKFNWISTKFSDIPFNEK